MRIIKHAAIKRDNIIYVGKRHFNCRNIMVECGLSLPVTKGAIQGFVDNEGNFLTREEALIVAEKAGQIIVKHGPKNILFSEDIY